MAPRRRDDRPAGSTERRQTDSGGEGGFRGLQGITSHAKVSRRRDAHRHVGFARGIYLGVGAGEWNARAVWEAQARVRQSRCEDGGIDRQSDVQGGPWGPRAPGSWMEG
jgi:hypothetical protein